MDVAAREKARVPAPVMTMQPTSSSALMRATASVQLAAQLVAHRVELRGAIHGEDCHPL
jgi:hypothetical protein